MYSIPFPLEPSLWAKTACPAPSTTSLKDDIRSGVLVIGGGFAGLSTALHLAQEGQKVVLLEAKEIGFGASGRNGGQVIPGLKFDPAELMTMFGDKRGKKLVEFAGKTADTVFDLIKNFNMNVPHVRKGWIQGSHNQETLALARKRSTQWSQLGAPARMLSREEIGNLLGTDIYLGGWIDERAGAIQPLSYARELARVALSLGAEIFTESAVTKLSQHGSAWQASTSSGGSVTADKVVICTNGYSQNLWPHLQSSVIDAISYLIATPPLPESLRNKIAPGGQVCSDARNLLIYFRQDHEGRFVLGGRGPFREPKGPEDWGHIERVTKKMFPFLSDIPIEHKWCGRVAVTRDFLPHIHEPKPGLLIDIGCMGRGVGLQSSMGRAIAQYLTTGNRDVLPFASSDIKPLPLYGLRRLYVNALMTCYSYKDL
jgi:glycine/D-amino acid oxidase-like deaminating enzyme